MIRQVCATVAIYIFSLHWQIYPEFSAGYKFPYTVFRYITPYGQKLTEVSDAPADSIFRLELVLKMEAAGSFEAYVNFYPATRRHITENSILVSSVRTQIFFVRFDPVHNVA